jgi:Reverse transcriptase (RNA-dependent DNA polymerase)
MRGFGAMDLADDVICHCRSEEQARTLSASLERRFAECGLTLHPEKTKIVYCKDDDRRGTYRYQKFDFLGYTFRPRLSRRWQGEVNFEALAEELVKIAANAGVVFGSMFRNIEPHLLLTKAENLEHANNWKKKYFGGPDVWEETK